MASKDQLHLLIAQKFYSSGLPFCLAKNRILYNSHICAAKNLLSRYLPPGYNLLRNTLLGREKTNIERLLQPIKDGSTKGHKYCE